MRLLGRTLCVASLAVLLIGVLALVRSGFVRDSPEAALPLESRESPSYSVGSNEVLEFRLSGHADQVRLRAHGLVPRYGDDMPRRTHEFALTISILAADGTQLGERTEHYRTALVRFRDPVSGRPARVNFVADPSVDVVGTALTIIDLEELSTAEVLRIRPAQADPDIMEVGLRVYEPEALPEHSIAASWQRLSVPQRERLAEGNVYPMPLLTDEEIAAIMTRRWRPVGPTGIEGEDYRVRTLFVREEGDGQPDKLLLPAGMYVDAQHRAAVEVADAGRYLVQATAVTGPGFVPEGTPMLGIQIASEQPIRLPWSGSTMERTIDVIPGTLAVSSDRPAAIRLFRLTASKPIEVRPSRSFMRSFPLTPAHGLEFVVHRRLSAPTVVRLDLLQWLSAPDASTIGAAGVTYTVVDNAGKPIESGTIEVDSTPSPLASLLDDPVAVLSTPNRLELTLAPDAVGIHLESDRTVYVTAHNQIQSDGDGSGTDPLARPSRRWFSFMPVGGRQLIQEGRTIVIVEGTGQLVDDGDDHAP